VITIAEVRGKFILQIDRLLSEFNPEVAEEARKEMAVPITEMTEDGWYEYENLLKYIKKVSPEAQRVLGKKVIYAAGERFEMFKSEFEKPVDLIKFVIENFTGDDFRHENFFEQEILESGDEYVKFRLDTIGMPTYYEGIYQGILEKYRIIRTNIKTTVEEENNGQQICTMEIKWQ
jgi:hypothetical protein